MNPYYNAMDRCTPPEGMGERLAQNVLSALPGRAGAFKPRGFRKKTAAVLLAGSLAAVSVLDMLFHFGEVAVSTINMLVAGLVSFGVLIIVCIPMSRIRFVLCVTVISLFCAAMLLFPGFFSIAPVFELILSLFHRAG